MKHVSDKEAPLRREPLSPSTILIAGFAATILVGTCLLMLPAMSVSGRISPIDALFTATSAVCVTGLIVVDTGSYFTLSGQSVILVLIQVGGLGIFTFSTFFMAVVTGKTSLRGRLLIQETMTHFPYRNLLRLLGNILLFTFMAEILGALSLWFVFRERLGNARGAYFSVFHSVSAFCNAGFSLWSNSLEDYYGNVPVTLTVMFLIVLGGLGFAVVTDIGTGLLGKRSRVRKLSLNSRLVLTTTFALIVVGAVLFWLLERHNILAGKSLSECVLVSLFQSVTARTAGFNTVPINGLTSAALFVLIVLMFIGASPGSVGGGIKTTTFAINFMIIVSYLRGRNEIELFGRTIPRHISLKAMATMGTSVGLVVVSALLIQILETRPTDMAEHTHFLDWMFEVVSAYGTVGLSTGATAGLCSASKLVIIGTMFAGRVGPLALVLSLFRFESAQRFKYPEENVMIG